MRRIFEDLLDDIDIENDSDVVSRLGKDEESFSQYDFVLYIMNSNSITKRKNTVNEYIKLYFNELERQLDVYLDSYHIDIFEIDDNNEVFKQSEDLFFVTKEMYGNVCVRLYFNFDGNLSHMLNFIYSLYYFFSECISYYLYKNNESSFCNLTQTKIISCYDTENIIKEGEKLLIYDPKQPEIKNAEYITDILLDIFWKKYKVLNFKEFSNNDQIRTYMINKIEKFIDFKKNETLRRLVR